jgi:hypothetical protein
MSDPIFGDQAIYNWDDGGLTIDAKGSRIVVPLIAGDSLAQFALDAREADELACVLNNGVEHLGGEFDFEAMALTWGQSVSRVNGQIVLPLHQRGEWFADIPISDADAVVLADMLRDAAGNK